MLARRRQPRMRELRMRLGLTLEDLARDTGVAPDALRQIESGRRQPLITTALKIARSFDVEVEAVFGEPRCR